MSYHRLPTAPLASRHRGAGSGAVDNRHPQGSTYLHPISVQSNGATSIGVLCQSTGAKLIALAEGEYGYSYYVERGPDKNSSGVSLAPPVE
jgi:hypothetical protein